MSQIDLTGLEQVYERLGLRKDRLGCVMMRTACIEVSDILDTEDIYYPPTPDAPPWIGGIPCESKPHVSLIYGLVRPAFEMKDCIEVVLQGWQMRSVRISQVSVFTLRDYDCLVAEVAYVPCLVDANLRLRSLPHVDVWPDYRPHITLAFLKKNTLRRNEYVLKLNLRLKGRPIPTHELSYGDDR